MYGWKETSVIKGSKGGYVVHHLSCLREIGCHVLTHILVILTVIPVIFSCYKAFSIFSTNHCSFICILFCCTVLNICAYWKPTMEIWKKLSLRTWLKLKITKLEIWGPSNPYILTKRAFWWCWPVTRVLGDPWGIPNPPYHDADVLSYPPAHTVIDAPPPPFSTLTHYSKEPPHILKPIH